MISILMPTVLATTLYLSSSVTAVSPTHQVVFTRVLPEKNYVAYDVEKSESLKNIAQDYYGDEVFWTTVWNDNTFIKDPYDLNNITMIKLRVNKPEEPEELKPELQQLYDENLEEEYTQLVQSYVYYSAASDPDESSGSSVNSQRPTPSGPIPYEELYKAAGEKYGVPWQILYGLHMTETGGRDGAISNHSGSGAQGPMQFMPGTFNAYAVKADGGSGTPDINNVNDAVYTAANYMAKHGSIDSGLNSYGGNKAGVLRIASENGYSQ